MQTRDLAAEAEPQTAARFGASLATEEAIENKREIAVGDPRATVGNPHDRLSVARIEREGDTTTFGRELERIVEQIDQQPAQMIRVAFDENAAVQARLKRQVLGVDQRLHCFGDLLHQRAQVERGAFDYGLL